MKTRKKRVRPTASVILSAVAVMVAVEGAVASSGPLSQITVTAQRRAQPVARSVTALSYLGAETLNLIRADHVSEALNRLAGVNIQRGNGQEHLTALRSPVLTGGAGAGSFLYLEDGVPLRAPGFANVNGLFEAHTELAGGIEVIRGPGSALYGSNAVHGLINVLTPAPAAEFEAFAEGLWGAFGRGRLRASVSGTRGRHGIFAGLTLLHEAGYRQAAGLDQQKVTLRSDYDGGGTRLTATFSAHNLNQETAGFIRGPNAYKDSALARTNPNPEAFRDARALRAALRWERDLSPDLMLSVTPYVRWNEMDFLMHFLPSKALEKNGHKSIGVQNTLYWTFADTSQLILGADVDVTDGYLKETQSKPSFGSFPQGAHYDYDVFAVVGAAYGHGEWQVSENLRLVGGVRFEVTRYDYDNHLAADTIGRFQRPADRTDTFTAVTPKLGAVYDLAPAMQVFVHYARGARAPQTTDLYRLQVNQSVGDIKVEKLDSVEAGLRGAFLGGRYQLTGYYMKKRNFFFRDADGFNVTAGRTRHVGVEAEVSVPLPAGFEITGSATYARHSYRFTRSVASQSTESIVSGNDIDTAPRLLSNARLAWQPRPVLRVELEWGRMGRYYTDAANLHAYPGHDLFNLRAEWRTGPGVRVFAAIRNLTGTDYAERADFAFGSERYFPGEARAFEGGLSFRL